MNRAKSQPFGLPASANKGHKGKTMNKTCTKCSRSFPATIEYFNKTRKNKLGLVSQCKDCVREWHRNHNAKPEQKERSRQIAQAWRHNNRDKCNAAYKKYHAVHADELRKRRKIAYANDAVRQRARSKAWKAQNPDMAKEHVRRRRRARLKASGHHTGKDVLAQLKRQHGECYYCHVKLSNDYHVDHVVPLSRGGSDGPENIVIACASCNHHKSFHLPHEWPAGGHLL